MVKFINNYRQIHDPIHGFIKMSNLACRIVDTPFFQRLRNLHQLGTCHYVFPSSTHTRFEHSIGTYYLTDRILNSIKNNSNKELLNIWLDGVTELKPYYSKSGTTDKLDRLDPFVCELIKIAGLTHDLGHGPFSHLFDDVYLPTVISDKNDPSIYHEYRSIMILKHIIQNDDLLKECITDDCLEFIQKLIDPDDGCDGFVYQIVSNSFNSIDIDKFDYMARDTHMLGLKFGFDYGRLVDEVKVLDNKLCFPDKMNYEVASIFWTRYRLHKQIYSHRSVVSIQYMISDIMRLIDPIVGVTESIHDLDKFCDLTDDYIILTVKQLKRNMDHHNKDEQDRITQAYQLLQRIISRRIYHLATSFISGEKIYLDVKALIESGYKIDPSKIIIHKTKIGFVSGNKENPLDNLYFYNHRNPDVCLNIKREQLSILLPDEYQEHLYMIYVKDKDDKQTIEQIEKVCNDLDKFT